MKIVYVLTCSKNDYYLEQLVLSLASLRLYNETTTVEIIMDEESYGHLSTTDFRLISAQKAKITSIQTPPAFSQMQRSRWLKTNLRNLVVGDFLFIDTDTIICDKLDFYSSQGEIYAVRDLHVDIVNHAHQYDILHRASLINWTIEDLNQPYHNSGVLWVRDSQITHEFYNRWHEEWLLSLKAGCASDQPAFCKANAEMGYIIQPLDDKWNCQVVENGLRFLENAKIIHYFASGQKQSQHPFKLNSKEIYESIRKNNNISEEVMYFIQNPKSAFYDITQILSDEDVKFYNSPFCKRLRTFYYRHTDLYNKMINYSRKIKKL